MSLSVSVLYLGDPNLIAPFANAVKESGIKLYSASLNTYPFQSCEPTAPCEPPPLFQRSDTNGWELTPPDYHVILVAGNEKEFYQQLSPIKLHHPSALIIWLGNTSCAPFSDKILASGAFDYLLFPFTSLQLVNVIQSSIKSKRAKDIVIAEAPQSRQVLKDAARAALTDTSILLHGESGTGKEVLAQYIHNTSDRASQPFVAVNCAAFPESMLEAMLFGYKKGAFTGASNDYIGKFEAANGGTIFLDEITEIPLNLQAKLLRVLQEKTIEKLGCNKTVKLDVRVISATNRTFGDLKSSACLRADVFYRISVINISWPALKDRKQDIIPLAEFFLRKYGGKQGYQLNTEAVSDLCAYEWPGNVRELENRIQRGLVFAKSIYLTSSDLGFDKKSGLSEPAKEKSERRVIQNLSYRESQRLIEFQNIKILLDEYQGNRKEVAARLNLTTRGLRYKLQQMRERNFL